MTEFELNTLPLPSVKESTTVKIGATPKKGVKLLEPGECLQEKKAPRRVLYFSDGTLEEYSTDEDEDAAHGHHPQIAQLIRTSDMTWAGWLGYQVTSTSSKALAACDYVGENIAYYLGITSPKYQYELEEHQRTLKEEEEEKRQVREKMMGWKIDGDVSNYTSSIATPSTMTPPASLPEFV